MIYKKLRKISTIFSILFLIISVIGLAYVSAEIEIITDLDTVEDGIINLLTSEAIAFNNNTGNVNASDLWITNEGVMDNVPDLYASFIAAGFNDSTLDQLSDVDTTGVSTSDFLQKSAGDWLDFDLFGTANTWTAAQTFNDARISNNNALRFLKGASNTDLQAQNSLGNIVVTLPGITTTLPGLSLINTWTAAQIIDGSADAIQLRVQGNSLQITNIFVVENSAGTDLLIVEADGTLQIPSKLEHLGDTNTHIAFTADDIEIKAGGMKFMKFNEFGPSATGKWFVDETNEGITLIDDGVDKLSVVVNDEAANISFRVESQDHPNMLFVDPDSNKFGINESSPTHLLTVNGNSNITQNATFEKDVIIDGTLFGGSPVKIAGINITDNVFDLMENRNSTSRFTLQNTNESTNATAVISAVNDVGGSMFIGIGSSSFVLGGISRPNITALASKSRGEMVFANFFKEAFIWLYNPSDDNDPTNLVEIMRVDENGLNLSIGNITGNTYYAGAFFESSTGDTIELTTPEAEVNITGLTFTALNGFHNDTNHSLIVQKTGTYKVDISLSAAAVQSGGEYDFAMLVNGVEQSCTEVRRNIDMNIGAMSGTCILKLNENDQLSIGIDDEADPVRDIVIYYLGWTIVWVGH